MLILDYKPELRTFKWDILNPDRLINLEINNRRRKRIIWSLEIKKKRKLSIDLNFHHSNVFSSVFKGWLQKTLADF